MKHHLAVRETGPRAKGAAAGFLPSFCRVGLVFGVVVSAELLALVLVLGVAGSWAELWQRLSLLSLYVQWIALGSAALLCLLRPWLTLGRRLEGLLAWLSIQAVATLVALGASQWVPASDWSALAGAEATILPRTLAVSGIVGALLLRYLYLHHQWQRQVVAESSARFEALQARIRPHFLFNSLNSIAGLTRLDPARAEALVEDLAELFRASLAGEKVSTLGREIELGRRYLAIESQRLGERLRVTWDLDTLPLQAALPPLVLQPLLENAVHHGIEPSATGGWVQITGRYRRGRVNLGIRNSLPNPSAHAHRAGNQLALDNVRQRLEALFPGAASLREGRVEGDFQVRMVFPFPWRPL